MDDRFVTIKTMQDAVQARMIRNLLEQEGIPVATPGLEHRAMLGMVGPYIAIPIQVPASLADRALDIIEALDDPDAELPASESATGYESSTEEPIDEESTPSRLKRVAVFLSLFPTFGCGHFYVRKTRAGVVLAVSELLALQLVAGGLARAAWAIPVLLGVDALGAVAEIEEQRGGRPFGVLRATPYLAALCVVAFSWTWFQWRLHPVESVAAETGVVCRAAASCNGADAQACVERMQALLRSGDTNPASVVGCAQCLGDSPSCQRYDHCHDRCFGRGPRALPSH